MKLCTNDVEIFLHFHAFLRADSGMGSLLTPVFTRRKNPMELPVVKITELSSMPEMFVSLVSEGGFSGPRESTRREVWRGGRLNGRSRQAGDGGRLLLARDSRHDHANMLVCFPRSLLVLPKFKSKEAGDTRGF